MEDFEKSRRKSRLNRKKFDKREGQNGPLKFERATRRPRKNKVEWQGEEFDYDEYEDDDWAF